VTDTPTPAHPCTHITRAGSADCAHCPVHHLALFGELPDAETEAVRGRIDHFLYPPGTTLYSEASTADFVFTIRHGLVKLVYFAPNGGERIVRIHGAGDMIGMAAVVGRRYQHSAICIGEVDACRIPAGIVHELGTTRPHVIEGLNQRWEATVEKADYWITAFSTGAVRGRLLRLLLYLIELQRRPDGKAVQLLSGQDMAAIIGTTAETISRELSALRREGTLARVHNHTFDCDVPALERMAAE